MTNSEAIEVLEMERIFRNGSNTKVEAIDVAISALEENTKLKAEIDDIRINLDATYKKLHDNTKICSEYQKEIEQLKELTRYQQEFSVDNKTIGQLSGDEYIEFIKSILWKNYDATKEIEQLKSELEKSVKLPCKVGDIVYVIYSVKGRKPVISENKFTLKYYADNINYFGRTIFLTREEAEQHLEDKQLRARIEEDNVKKDFKEFCDSRDVEESKLKLIEVE